MSWDKTISDDYGWVILVALSSWFLNLFQFFFIGRARKKDKVFPPITFAEGKDRFNGAFRAHQNTLEMLPFFLVALLLAGLRHTVESAGVGLGWIAARILYSVAYYSGHNKGRMGGFFLTMLIQLTLTCLAISTAAGYLDWW